MTHPLEKYYRPNSDGQPIPDHAALAHATDTEYFDVLPEARCRVRAAGQDDPAPVISNPTGMTPYVIVARDHSPLAMYFVDSRVRLYPGVNIGEVLHTHPTRWGDATKRQSQVSHTVGDVKPSILVPFLPD